MLPADIAFLEDRVLIMEDNPQLYGTQFHMVNHHSEPFPIVDFAHVDERRARVGLEDFAANQARIRTLYDA